MRKLTDRGLSKLTKPGLYRVADTLYLRVKENGRKYWTQRIVINGKRTDIGLGAYPVVTLLDAEDAALTNRRMVHGGGDPLADKRRAKAPLFRAAADSTLEGLRARWRNGKTEKRWHSQMDNYVFPVIGGMRIDQVTQVDVLRILTPIWTETPSVAVKVRQSMKAVFAWGQAHRFIETNPAGDVIDGALPKQTSVKEHYKALPHMEVAKALNLIDQSGAGMSAKLCLRLLILSACRSGEARGARWDEIDTESRTWTIPASRTKSGREHSIPLTAAALSVLDRAMELRDKSGLVFPSPRGSKELTDMSLSNILRMTGLISVTTVHGFRSTFRDWCGETGKSRELAEAALSHTLGNSTELAYKRSELLDQRRPLMKDWASYILERPALRNVAS